MLLRQGEKFSSYRTKTVVLLRFGFRVGGFGSVVLFNTTKGKRKKEVGNYSSFHGGLLDLSAVCQ